MDDNESFIENEFGCVVCDGSDCDCQPEPQPNPFDHYRIRRSDAKNIVIEKFGEKLWHVISYHGNSASSLLSGLFNVVMAEYTPQDAKLPQQLETLRLELVSSVSKVEKMIKEADLGD